MITVTEAVEAARKYVADFAFMIPNSDMRLEETEIGPDGNWIVTLSFAEFPGRIYKRFLIHGDNGQVLSMKRA